MKKKIILLLVTIITCMASVFGFTACNDSGKTDIPSDGNMLTTVFTKWADGDKDGFYLVNCYVTGGAGWTSEGVTGYEVEDLASDKLSFKNYSIFSLKWKTRNYKVTKIEFDIVAQLALSSTIRLGNPNVATGTNIAVDVKAGETKHISIDCDFQKNTDLFNIVNSVSDDVKGTISWKLANLYVTAEKV